MINAVATYAEGTFKVGEYDFGIKVRDGFCPKNVYVHVMTGSYSNGESFLKREIGHRSTDELAPEITTVAHKAAAHAKEWLIVRDDPNFEENFVKSLEPIIIEGINGFNGIKPASKEKTRLQRIISTLRGK